MISIKKKQIAFVMAVCMSATGLVGCSSNNDKYQNVMAEPFVTKLELSQNYENESKQESIITRQTVKIGNNVEMIDVTDGGVKNKLEATVANVEQYLNMNQYNNNQYITEAIFESIKSSLDNKVLNNGRISSVKRTRDMYVVDVEYDMTLRNAHCEPNKYAQYVGIHGAFSRDGITGKYILNVDRLRDMAFKAGVTLDLPQASVESTQGKVMDSTEDNGSMSYGFMSAMDAFSNSSGGTSTLDKSENTDDTIELDGDRVGSETSYLSVGNVDGTEIDIDQFGRSYIEKYYTDIDKMNRNYGSALSNTAIVPDIAVLANMPAPEGELSGYGIYDEGNHGLGQFGFETGKLRGNAVVRYIFKKESDTQLIHIDNVYVLSYELTEGTPAVTEYDIFPEFATNEIDKMIEREDRIESNNDISSMFNGSVYGNKRMGMYYAFRGKFTQQSDLITKRVESIARSNRLWLVSFKGKSCETVVASDKGTAVYNNYGYKVIEQIGNEFKIVDTICVKREPVSEPDLNYANNRDNRFTYLYNACSVSDKSKAMIKEFMANEYNLYSNKSYGDIKMSIDPDQTMLRLDDRKNIYYQITGLLAKNTQSSMEYDGAITEWLGGSSDPQVEIRTLEILPVSDEKALEIQCYYLVSVFNDIWVIDDYKQLSVVEISGEDNIEQLRNDIKALKN